MSAQVESTLVESSVIAPSSLISARGVSKIYKMGQTDVAALDDVSMSVTEGDSGDKRLRQIHSP